MKILECTNILKKIYPNSLSKPFKMAARKETWYISFLLLTAVFYLSNQVFRASDKELEDSYINMNQFGEQLIINKNSMVQDSVVLQKEHEQLIFHIEDRIVKYLYQIPDYSYIPSLEPYFEYSPELLSQIPSAVPLEKGDYIFSSEYGIRKHPISGLTKPHFGIDFSAPANLHIYTTASGTVVDIKHSKTGYGTHIIVKHRFGFETLYGHLNKVLVIKGQKLSQHELIGTVGSSGSSTGHHLHYEVIKNAKKINPLPSLSLKYRVYMSTIR